MSKIAASTNADHDIQVGSDDWEFAAVTILVVAADLVVILLSSIIAGWWRFSSSSALDTLIDYLGIHAVAIGSLICFLWMQRSYKLEKVVNLPLQIYLVLLSWSAALLLTVAFMFLTKTGDYYSRLWFVAWAVAGACSLVLLRVFWLVFFNLAKRKGRLIKNIVIVGDDRSVRALIKHFKSNYFQFLHVGGVVMPAKDFGSEPLEARVLGPNLRESLEDIKSMKSSAIVIASGQSAGEFTANIVGWCCDYPIDIVLAPPAEHLDACNVAYYGNLPTFVLAKKPLSGGQMLQKRLFDIMFSSLALILFAPFLIIIAIAIKVDSRGPVMFRQERGGYAGRIFKIFKFRTMYERRPTEPDVPQARRNDPRVTAVGAVLRRLSLDELPQLINVLKGDMSLVGPRPLALAHNEKYHKVADTYILRHKLKPGMTGWAQVNGRRGEINDNSMLIDRLNFDIFYVNNWSFRFDLEILLRTMVVLWGKNAY